ncbi:hypothetical protein CSAL01_13261 [Colletotrichum salicis]|uniref:Uncharacterized protein n=1 Tax=Colletotrichum salicis TaxID=1209931 RepID=A0A135UHW5_9PEZI|nr:hypothetical protein CSAL01_13261 [Colletotrichum salicis]
MSSYPPVPTTVEFPGAELQDSLSINSRSQLMSDEGTLHSNAASQQYELRNIPSARQSMHAINRKPVPTSSAPWNSPKPGRVHLRNSISGHGYHETTGVNDTPNTHKTTEPETAIGTTDLGVPRQTQGHSYKLRDRHNRKTPGPSIIIILPLRHIANRAEPMTAQVHSRNPLSYTVSGYGRSPPPLSVSPALASITGVLSYEQGRRLDQWGLGKGFFSPTVVVSFLGTLAKSACLLALTEIISQLKWLHFQHKPQKLTDLQLFDNASRGPWGAFQLASRRNRKTVLASFASLLVVVSLAGGSVHPVGLSLASHSYSAESLVAPS